MRKILSLVALALFGQSAAATTITLQPNTVQAGIAVTVPANARLLTVSMQGGTKGKIEMYLRADADFNTHSSLPAQASYYSANKSGKASISVGDYGTPALHSGKWYVALVNHASQAATITLDAATSTNNAPNTDFQINFGEPSAQLEQAWGGADKLECDVAPWSDSTPLGSTTVGQFRKDLLLDAAQKMSTQIHSPVPVRIQACWKDFDDSGEHAGSYTLAAATGTYIYWNTPGVPAADTIYSMAPASRLAGTLACNMDSSVDCSIPDIIVWYNKADVAKQAYDDASDEPLIVSVTMHEITHGLGFLSDVAVSNPDECDADPQPADMDCNQIGKLFTYQGRKYNDAYTANVAHLLTDPDHPLGTRSIVPFADLTLDQRQQALTSGKFLVWNDATLATAGDNILRNNAAPTNLVELHAPSVIQPGSTLSHLNAVHVGQLMTAVIQGNYPDTLGLAGPMLERVGWNTGPAEATTPSGPPQVGSWYDPAHSGHGIDFEKIFDDPAGDQYAVLFYSYDNDGKADYFYAGGRLRDGRFEDFVTPGQPAAMGHPVYDPATHGATYPGPNGTLGIDFTSAAADDPACAGNASPVKALLTWEINGESGTWCVSPLIDDSRRPSAEDDLNGLWNAGSGDSGWGFSMVESIQDSGPFLSPLLVYYFGTDNQPHWAQAEVVNYAPGQTVNLYRINGYCRTCAKQATTHDVIGTMTLNLTRPENTETPSGDNRVSIDINAGGTLKFKRTNAPVRTYSQPAGG